MFIVVAAIAVTLSAAQTAFAQWVPDQQSSTARVTVVANQHSGCTENDQNEFLLAINIKDGSLIPCECVGNGDCNLNSVFQTIVNVTQLILAMVGSLALLMFTYGGLMFIIAAGAQERIQKAKQILVAASIGVAIIFSAWLIVNIVIGTLTSGTIHSEAKIFDRIWSEAPSG